MSYHHRGRPPSPRGNRPVMYRFGNDTSSRQFDFRPPNQQGPGPSFPSGRPRSRSGTRQHHQNYRSNNHHGPPHRHRGFFRKLATSDRAILHSRRSPTPELMSGMNIDTKYNVLEDLQLYSPSNEQSDVEMAGKMKSLPIDSTNEVIDLSPDSDDDHPRAKRAKLAVNTDSSLLERPKWSNPDPYTSLPPTTDGNGNKKDVVEMIRKAKVHNMENNSKDTAADEFISLNFDDEQEDDGQNFDHISHSHPKIPTSPRDKSRLKHNIRKDNNTMDSHDTRTQLKTDHWPPPPRGERSRGRDREYSRGSHYPPHRSRSRSRSRSPIAHDRQFHRSRSPLPPYDSRYRRDRSYSPHIRGEGEEDHDQGATFRRADPRFNDQLGEVHGQKRKRQDRPTDMMGEWLPSAQGDPSPWMAYCRPCGSNPAEWLHEEILQFHHFVAPRDCDHHMRTDLIDRVSEAFRAKYPGVAIKSFGSFATSLYLPTGDMDLVAMSASYQKTGYATMAQSRNQFNAAGKLITIAGLGYSQNGIFSAKVPIIKYTDRKTGLRVDLSFENDTGVKAVATLNIWLDRYPALSRIVYLIKQLLAMSGLNDLDDRYGPDWLRDNLDFVLMDFLDFYGNQFDYRFHGLDMRAMDYILKSNFRGNRIPKADRLLVVDPNKEDNDVSGGTAKIKNIFAAFSKAHRLLDEQMSMARSVPDNRRKRSSILNCILGGDYSSFDLQRLRLEQLYDKEKGIFKTSSLEPLVPAPTPVQNPILPSYASIGVDRVARNDERVDKTDVDRGSYKVGQVNQDGISFTRKGKPTDVHARPKREDNIPLDIDSIPESSFSASKSSPVLTKTSTANKKDLKKSKSEPKQMKTRSLTLEKRLRKANQTKKVQEQSNNNPAIEQAHTVISNNKLFTDNDPLKQNKSSKVNKKQKPSSVAKAQKKIQGNKQRAQIFKERFPNAQCPPQMTKALFKQQCKIHSV